MYYVYMHVMSYPPLSPSMSRHLAPGIRPSVLNFVRRRRRLTPLGNFSGFATQLGTALALFRSWHASGKVVSCRETDLLLTPHSYGPKNKPSIPYYHCHDCSFLTEVGCYTRLSIAQCCRCTGSGIVYHRRLRGKQLRPVLQTSTPPAH